ncbi:MAG: AsmA-like C-terminal domain-containing protein, partial [Myxococcota bacterium]
LEAALGGDVDLGELRIYLGWGIRFEGHDLTIWPGEDDAGLHVERLVADVRPLAHLTGQLRLRRVLLEGATLRVSRAADGTWTPAAFEQASGGSEPPDRGRAPHPHELLQPLISLESRARELMARRRLADSLELRDGRIEWLDAAVGSADAPPLVIERIRGELRRRMFVGSTHLSLRGRLSRAGADLGSFEWDGGQSRSGELRLAIAATELELATLVPYLRPDRAVAELSGRLSGAVVFETPEPGHGRLEVDAVGLDLHSRSDSAAPWELVAVRSERSALTGELAISPEQVSLERMRFESEEVSLEIDGTLGRPLRSASRADLALTLHDLSVADVRHLLGWLPDVRRDEAEVLLARIETGRLRTLRTGGTATFSDWQAFLAGRTKRLPRHFVIDADLVDTTVRVGDEDRLRELEGRLWWTGERMELRGVRAHLNDSPLPKLDLSVEGMGHLFATDAEARQLTTNARPLEGLATLWKVIRRPDSPQPNVPLVSLDIERLDHPVFFWPIAQARAEVAPLPSGLRVASTNGTWAGVPIEGELAWTVVPEETVTASLVARRGERKPLPELPAGSWTRGRLEVGAVDAGRWQHQRIQGRFEASGSTLWLTDGEVTLAPAGGGQATLRLGLGDAEAVPFELSFAAEDCDVPMIARLVKLPPRFLTGQVGGAGVLSGKLAPGERLSPTLDGVVQISARDGSIRQDVPAVMALALASEAFNPFAKRDQVRYDRLESVLEFDRGKLHTEGLVLEGPDVRAFASGEATIGAKPNALDVEVVLFLFRPVDSIIQKIPIVNFLLLGKNENLMAAHYELQGTWQEPDARLVPLRTLATGPASLVFETVPSLVKRGLEALDGLIEPGPPEAFPLSAPAARPAES